MRDLFADFGVPLDEFRMLDDFNGLDANRIKQGDGVSSSNIEDGGNHTADVRANFYNAFHVLDFPKAFDGGFNHFTMRFDKVKLSFVLGNLFGIMMGIDFCQIKMVTEFVS